MAAINEYYKLQMEPRPTSKLRMPQAGLAEMNPAKTNSRSGLKAPGFATSGIKPSGIASVFQCCIFSYAWCLTHRRSADPSTIRFHLQNTQRSPTYSRQNKLVFLVGLCPNDAVQNNIGLVVFSDCRVGFSSSNFKTSDVYGPAESGRILHRTTIHFTRYP
jgi:hypothetical protein